MYQTHSRKNNSSNFPDFLMSRICLVFFEFEKILCFIIGITTTTTTTTIFY